MGKKEYVHRSFAAIAQSYNLLNTLLSFGLDARWRHEAIKALGLSGGGLCWMPVPGPCDWAGGLISGRKEVYHYLRTSIMAFSKGYDVMAEMQAAGFSYIRHLKLTGGIVELYVADKTIEESLS